MIGKVSRGWRVGGLLRYLLGPGRFNEHTDPHVVDTWDDRPHAWQWSPGSECRELAAALAAPQLTAGLPQHRPTYWSGGKIPQGPVWHCSLRNHADDRVLSDAEWAEIAREVLDRTGIAPRGDPFACRWVLVRHAADHVHLAAVLVRQDTAWRVHPKFDHRKVGQVARETEARLGLTPTSPFDRTAPRHPTRVEQEKAQRRDAADESERIFTEGQPARVVLCDAARRAARQARDPEEFVELVSSAVVRVRVHRDRNGQIDGYALSFVSDDDAAGKPVWFSGSRLARDLSTPRLRNVWASADGPLPAIPPEPTEHFRAGRAEYLGALDQATRAVHDATEVVREAVHDNRPQHDASVHTPGRSGRVRTGRANDDEFAASTSDGERTSGIDGVNHSLRDLLDAIGAGARLDYPELGDTARLFDRAARTPYTVLPNRWSEEARHLRTAAWRLARVGPLPGRGPGREPLAALVAAVAALVAEIAAYQAAKQRLAQAHAARRCADALAVMPEKQRRTHLDGVAMRSPAPASEDRHTRSSVPALAQRPMPTPDLPSQGSPNPRPRRGRGR